MLKKSEYKFADLFFSNLEVSKDCIELCSLYNHLFSIFGKKELDTVLKMLYINYETNSESWFFDFHKSLRQCDFFTNCFNHEKETILNTEERKELENLETKVRAGGYVMYEDGSLIFTEEYRKYIYLKELKKREQKPNSIDGHLDMILWNAIYVDTENILEKIFVATFCDFDKEKKLNKI